MPPPTEPNNSYPPPPAGFMEYFATMFAAQNGSLPSLTPQPPMPPAVSSTQVPSTLSLIEARIFDRLGRGQGGILAEKEKVSKDIKASPTKRKSLVDPEVETSPPAAPNHPGKSIGSKARVKRRKTTGARWGKQSPPVSLGSAEATSDLNLPVSRNDQSLSDISTPTPPRPVSHRAKPCAGTRPPPSSIVDVPSDDDNNHPEDNNGAGAENISDHSELEVEVSTPALNHTAPVPTLYAGLPTTLADPPLQLLQAFLTQLTGVSPAVPPVPSPATVDSQDGEKPSKGVKAYPEGWREILVNAKNTVRAGLLLKQPFPTSKSARILVTEAFHETHTRECDKGIVPERGFSFDKNMMKVLLDEMSTARSDLKKLAKILVAADPGIFPLAENTFELNQTAPEIRMIAARMKRSPKPGTSIQPSNVRASVTARLTRFAFLNDPPTATGTLLANPIFGVLCRSFYEEERWKQALSVEVDGNDEWVSSVTITMASLAATSVHESLMLDVRSALKHPQYYAALEEWKTGRFIPKQFEADKYIGTYQEIFGYITGLVSDDLEAEAIDDRFGLWATESTFVQDLFEGASDVE